MPSAFTFRRQFVDRLFSAFLPII